MHRREVVVGWGVLAVTGVTGCSSRSEPSPHADEQLSIEVWALGDGAEETEPIPSDHGSIRDVSPIQRALDAAVRQTSPDGKTHVSESVPDRDRAEVETAVRQIPAEANDVVRHEGRLFRVLLAVTSSA